MTPSKKQKLNIDKSKWRNEATLEIRGQRAFHFRHLHFNDLVLIVYKGDGCPYLKYQGMSIWLLTHAKGIMIKNHGDGNTFTDFADLPTDKYLAMIRLSPTIRDLNPNLWDHMIGS